MRKTLGYLLLLLVGIGAGVANQTAKRQDVDKAMRSNRVATQISNGESESSEIVDGRIPYKPAVPITRSHRSASPNPPLPTAALSANPRVPIAVHRNSAMQSYLQLPMDFELNAGQAPGDVAYVAHGPGYALGLSPGVTRLRLLNTNQGDAPRLQPASAAMSLGSAIESDLQLQLVGANRAATASGIDEQPGRSNYFSGSDPSGWHRSVVHYKRVEMSEIYPGIDLVFYGNPQELEYDFVIAPGADPDNILWSISGAQTLSVDHEGDALLTTKAGTVHLHRPVSYQEINGKRKQVASRFECKGRKLHFALGPYDHSKTLVIDPVLVFSVTLGSSNGNNGSAINSVETDSSGYIYITGNTAGTDFPATAGAFDANPVNLALTASFVNFVAKMDPSASTLLYSDFIGGTGESSGWYVAPDANGNVYAVGLTSSVDFPLVGNIGKSTPPSTCLLSESPSFNCPDGFVFKLSSDGSQLLWSSLIGGSQTTTVSIVQLDPLTNDVVVMGTTNSSDLKPAMTTLQTTFAGTVCSTTTSPCFNLFLMGLDPNTGALKYGTFLGGAKSSLGNSLQLDSTGAIYVAGGTNSAFPPSIGAPTHTYPPAGGATAAGTDMFLMKLLRSAQNTLTVSYLTIIQGDADDGIAATTIDGAGDQFFIGSTASPHLPVTAGAYQSSYNNVNGSDCKWAKALKPMLPNACGSVVVGEVGPSGTLGFLTYLGGTGPDWGEAIGQDANGNLWLGGVTSSPNFPFSPDAYLTPSVDNLLAFAPFLAEMSVDGKTLPYATTIGSNFGNVYNITAVNNDLYVSGFSSAVPMTPGVYPPNPNAYSPAFLQKWDTTGTSPKISVSPMNLALADTAVGSVSPSQTVTIGNTGAGPMELAIVLAAAVGNLNNPGDFVTTNNCPASLAPNSSCTINVSFAPGAPNPACQGVIACTDSRAASLDIVSNAIGGLQVLSLTGNTGGGASLSVQPNPIVFPAQAAGTASQNLGVLVSNNGDIALSITNASITGPNAADFKAVLTSTGGPGCNLPVPTGGSYCQMEVQFSPAAGATGTRTANLVLTDTGIGSPQTIPLSGLVAGSTLNISPTSHSFGIVATGGSSTASFVISNPGTTSQQVSSITVSGANASEFTASNGNCPSAPPFTIGAGANCLFDLGFKATPTATGLQQATVTVAGVGLTGVPTLALSANVVTNTEPGLTYFVVPSPLDFGGVQIGQTTVQLSHLLTISNNAPIPCAGNAPSCGGPLNITSMIPGSSDFTLSPVQSTANCTLPPLTIPSGGSCEFQLFFTPSAAGIRNTNLTIVSNDPASPLAVPLLGTGLALPTAVIVPPLLNFGNAQTAAVSPVQTVTLQNVGKGPLGPSTLSISPNFAVASNNCNQTVPVGGTCTVGVTFTPPATGPSTGTLTFTNNASFGGSQIVALQGVGASGTLLLVAPTQLNYGVQPLNTASLPQTVKLTNTGTSAVAFPANAIRTSFDYHVASTTCGATLAAGANCSIQVTFMPTIQYPDPGSLLISNNAQGSPQTVYMNGFAPYNGYDPSTTALTSSANPVASGQPVTFTAHVTSTQSGTPTGTVFFIDGTTTIGTALLDGTAHATFTISTLAGGTHTITAVYSSDPKFVSSTSSAISQVVTGGSVSATSTLLTSSSNPSTVGAPITFTAAVSSQAAGTITGTVTFFDGSTQIGTGTLAGGTASVSTGTLTQGTHSITAQYGGDSNFAASTSPTVSQVVNASTKPATTTAIASSLNPSTVGQSITFTATVTSQTAGTITGTVNFFDGSTQIGTGTLAGGTASVSTGTLTQGTHSITAQYSGDTTYAGSTSPSLSQVVNASGAADFSIAFNPTAGSVPAGGSVGTKITITPLNGYTAQTGFACSSLPAYTTCTFVPTTLTPSGSAISAVLSFKTNANQSAALPWNIRAIPPARWLLMPLACLCCLALLNYRRRAVRRVAIPAMVLLLGVLLGIAGCNGGSSSGQKTPAGTYTVTVTASGGGVSHAANYTLTVQ